LELLNFDEYNTDSNKDYSKMKERVYAKSEEASNKDDANSAMQNGKFNNKIDEEDESESEVTISTRQFKQKIKNIYKLLVQIIVREKTNIREIFQGDIYLHKIKNEEYEAINLQRICEVLNYRDIISDTVDIYCLYSDLKYNEDYETIDVVKFEKRIDKYMAMYNKMIESEQESAFRSERGHEEDNDDRTLHTIDLKNSYS